MFSFQGNILLSSNERLVTKQHSTRIYNGLESSPELDNGEAFLTTHKLCWINIQKTHWISIPLQDIYKLETTLGFFSASSPKIIISIQGELKLIRVEVGEGGENSKLSQWTCQICLKVNKTDNFKCEECGVLNSNKMESLHSIQYKGSNTCSDCTFINPHGSQTCQMCGKAIQKRESIVKFSFRGGGMNEFLKHLQKAIADKSWMQSASVSVSNSNLVGVSGIIQTLDTQIKHQEQSLNDAFTDVDSLMSKAADMVKLANAIGSRLADLKDSEIPKEIKEFKNNLMTLGIQNPVSRESSSLDYHLELSRQITEFLDSYFLKNNQTIQMMSTIDLYCLFNRVRGGIDLVSPQDLMNACQELENSGKYRLKRFKSGTCFIQSCHFDKDQVIQRIVSYLPLYPNGLSALSLSQLCKISLLMAKEHLLLTEQEGLICRDESIEGLFFYSNLFLSFTL